MYEQKLVFYGFLGEKDVDSIAVDNIEIISTSPTTTTTTISYPPYWPCDYIGANGGGVNCDEIPIADVRDMFNRTPEGSLNFLILKLHSNEDTIPADLLGKTRVTDTLSLECNGAETSKPINVDPEAFSSTKSHTKFNFVKGCNLNQLTFEYLTGFSRMEKLRISASSNIHESGFSLLPALPNLVELRLDQCTGLSDIIRYPDLVRGLRTFQADINVNLDEITLNQMLLWIAERSSNTLDQLDISGNDLRDLKVLQFDLFERMSVLKVQQNAFVTISTGALQFSGKAPSFIEFNNCEVSIIENAAFQGKN